MNYIKSMNEVLDYIENNLNEEISIDEIAKIACISKFHLHRTFQFLAGENIGEYIRKRRLTKAAQEMVTGDKKIIDLAFEYGYSSPESFSRAFSKWHGVSPSKIGRNENLIKAYQRISFHLTVKGGEQMNYKIIEKESFKVLGKSIRVSTEDNENFKTIPKFWQESHKNGFCNSLMGKAGTLGILGVCMDMDEEDSKFTYMIAVEENQEIEGENLDLIDIPSQSWAVFECIGPMPDAMQTVWKKIFNEWFPSTGYKHADAPELEVYYPGNPNDENYKSEIWIPVVKE